MAFGPTALFPFRRRMSGGSVPLLIRRGGVGQAYSLSWKEMRTRCGEPEPWRNCPPRYARWTWAIWSSPTAPRIWIRGDTELVTEGALTHVPAGLIQVRTRSINAHAGMSDVVADLEDRS